MIASPAPVTLLATREVGPLRNTVAFPSPGVSAEAMTIDRALQDMRVWPPTSFVGHDQTIHDTTRERRIFEARLRAKLEIANVAMHLRAEWRQSLFKQLDDILDVDEWDSDDPFPAPDSIRTFLRMIIYLHFRNCPGLGISAGNVVAAWTHGGRRLTIECLPEDRTQWVCSRQMGNFLEIGSGLTTIPRLTSVLSPYEQPKGWIFHGEAEPRR